MKTFPFIFGEGLYIYDIENDIWKLVKMTKIPYLSFGNNLAMQGNRVYYDTFFEDSRDDVQFIDIKKGDSKSEFKEGIGQYVVSSDTMFFSKRDEAFENSASKYEKNNIYKRNLKTGKITTALEGAFSNIEESVGYLFCYEEANKEIVNFSIKTGSITKFKGFNYPPMCIKSINQQEFIYTDTKKILKYNMDTHVKTILKAFQGNEIIESLTYKNSCIYYVTSKFKGYKLDMKNFKEKEIFSLEKVKGLRKYIKKGEIYEEINFCNDYIVMDLTYFMPNDIIEIEHRKLVILDYSGKVIKNEASR